MSLEAEDTGGHIVEASEVGGSKSSALEDREVDLDLVDPARTLGEVDEIEILEAALETLDCGLASVDSATVDDDEWA